MFRHLCFRTHAISSLVLPLKVRSAGHYLLTAGQEEIRGAGSFIQIFWCVNGSGKIRLGRKTFPFRRGNVFIYFPGEKHHLKAGRNLLEYRWFTLDGDHAGQTLRSFGLKRLQSPGACPESLFGQLDPCLQDATAEGERTASLVAYDILLRASVPGGEKAFPAQQTHSAFLAKTWMEKHFTDARLNITTLSTRFHLHRSTLYRIFMTQYGVAPVQYLNRLRLRHAIEMLNHSPLAVADIAVQAGIPDIAYFSRLVRKNTGFSPRAYRHRHGTEKTAPAATLPPSLPVQKQK